MFCVAPVVVVSFEHNFVWGEILQVIRPGDQGLGIVFECGNFREIVILAVFGPFDDGLEYGFGQNRRFCDSVQDDKGVGVGFDKGKSDVVCFVGRYFADVVPVSVARCGQDGIDKEGVEDVVYGDRLPVIPRGLFV